jgi:crotonobetainyl-CoA:carnitine CoA-transferase CaiB-like acyl-CoA transferase
VFETKDDPVFIGVVTDSLWEKFCALFGLDDLWADESLRANNVRVQARDQIMPIIREVVQEYTRDEIINKLEGTGLPFAPIARPEDMFDDPHLNASGGLESVDLVGGGETRLPLIPIEMNGRRLGVSPIIPDAGQHTSSILASLGYDEPSITALVRSGAVE